MPVVLLRNPLAPEEIKRLKEEFPQFTIRIQTGETPLSPEEWAEVEVVYGEELESSELEEAHRLRWIHVPSSSHEGLCLDKIRQATNLLVTDTKSPDVHQVAEYAMGALLAAAKDLFYWHEKRGDPGALWESPHRDLMWTVRGKTVIQIGLGRIGAAIADYAGRLGMRVWGVSDRKTFHPLCQKTFGMGELNAILPNADVVCCALPLDHEGPALGHDQFDLVKGGSILLLMGLAGVDEQALIGAVKKERFRHVVIDASPNLPHKSPLWDLDAVTITPHVASCPETEARLEFHQFQYNFRRYIHADFDRMKNHV